MAVNLLLPTEGIILAFKKKAMETPKIYGIIGTLAAASCETKKAAPARNKGSPNAYWSARAFERAVSTAFKRTWLV